MDHGIKYQRAIKASFVGRFALSRQAMAQYIPAGAWGKLSGAELGELLDSIWAACGRGKAIAVEEAVGAGYIWSERHQRSLGIDKSPIDQREVA